jgi:sugar phosphate isomerase/epimerase
MGERVNPRFALIESMTPDLTFAEDVALCRRVGAEGIGVFEHKLDDTEADLATLAESGLQVSSAFPQSGAILQGPYSGGEVEPSARIAAIIVSVQRLARFRPGCICVTTGPRGSHTEAQAHAIVLGGFRQIAAAAADEGLTVALEIMHPSLNDLFSFVTDIPAAIALIDEVGAANVAIALDAWHVGDSPQALSALREHAAKFASFHLDDWREPTRSWADRVLPGDGVLDLEAVLRSLETGGFAGWYELEVVSDDGRIENAFEDSLWKLDPYDLVSAGKRQFMALWEQATAALGSVSSA